MRVLMVCLGNICRSPTAEAVMRARAKGGVEVDSAGTGGWHEGEAPDPRARKAGEARGYDFAGITARQVRPDDFAAFDVIYAMDANNLRNLRRRCPPEHQGKLRLLLDGVRGAPAAVPDPYYSGPDGFERVLDLVERGVDAHLARFPD